MCDGNSYRCRRAFFTRNGQLEQVCTQRIQHRHFKARVVANVAAIVHLNFGQKPFLFKPMAKVAAHHIHQCIGKVEGKATVVNSYKILGEKANEDEKFDHEENDEDVHGDEFIVRSDTQLFSLYFRDGPFSMGHLHNFIDRQHIPWTHVAPLLWVWRPLDRFFAGHIAATKQDLLNELGRYQSQPVCLFH